MVGIIFATAANTVNSLVKGKDPRVHFKPGNIIQFLSRASARTIQIVVANAMNELICDAIGGTGSYYPNAHWMVVVDPNGHYYFHNNYNYLAVRSGRAVIIPLSANDRPPQEGEFRAHNVLGSAEAILLEAVSMPDIFLAFDDDGQPVSDFRSKTRETFSQFEIHLIAYGPGIHPAGDDSNIEQPNEASPPSYWEATASSNRESQSKSST